MLSQAVHDEMPPPPFHQKLIPTGVTESSREHPGRSSGPRARPACAIRCRSFFETARAGSSGLSLATFSLPSVGLSLSLSCLLPSRLLPAPACRGGERSRLEEAQRQRFRAICTADDICGGRMHVAMHLAIMSAAMSPGKSNCTPARAKGRATAHRASHSWPIAKPTADADKPRCAA